MSYLQAFALYLTLFLFTACLPDSNSDVETDYVLVEIADRNFTIPKGYFNGRIPSRRDTQSVVLEYSLPGFEVLSPRGTLHKTRRQLINTGRLKGMLLENRERRPTFDVVVQNLMRNRNFKKVKSPVYRLEKYVHVPSTPATSNAVSMPYIEDDFYIERKEDGSIESYLRCSPPEKDKIPGCRHSFEDKGILYAIRWPIQELQNWEMQQNAAIKFIDTKEIDKLKD